MSDSITSALPSPITLGWPVVHDAEGRGYIRCDAVAALIGGLAEMALTQPRLASLLLAREAASLSSRNLASATDGTPKEQT